MTRRALGWLLLIATALICAHAYLATQLYAEAHQPIFYGASVEVALYALAALVVLRDRGVDAAATRRATVFILVTAGIMRVVLIPATPISTDINRYIWDGRVQSAGINPYAYIPADPALKFLRDDDIFPEINRADYAPTIYPPLAQVVFYLVTRVAETITVMKCAMVLFELVGVVAIMRLLAMRGIKSTRVLLYVWHPLPIWEFAGGGHVDAIALACVMLAVLAAESRKPFLAGVALGGAALVKFFPIVIAPALYRRWDWRAPLGGLATIVALYLPYVGAGKKIFGFLGGYSDEEGLRDGTGLYPFAMLRHLLPVPRSAIAFYMPIAAAILGVAGLAVLFRDRLPGLAGAARGRGLATIGGAFLLVTLYTVLTSPHFPWYFAWAIPFLCFVPYWPMVYLTGSSTLLYIAGWPPSLVGGSIFYVPFLVFVAIDLAIRVVHLKEKRHGHPVAAQTLG